MADTIEGYGLGGYGVVEPWGSVTFPGPGSEESLGDFNFQCRPLPEGFAIQVTFTAPASDDAPEWNRRVVVLRKKGEWPQSITDTVAEVRLDAVFPTATPVSFTDTGLEAGDIYYYALFAQRNDGVWIQDRFTDRCSSYPYDRWGFCEYLFGSMTRGMRSTDVATNHLFQFLCLLGTLLDDTKTDVEHLRTLMEIDSIHDDLIFMLDRRLGWPTWYAAGGLQRRLETKLAVPFYKVKGRAAAYEAILSELADFDVEVLEGWRKVMFSNGLYGSTTPDTDDPDTLAKLGTVNDIMKYTNDDDGWLSVGGLAFVLTDIPGVSGPLTSLMLDRVRELISLDQFLTSYVTTQIFAVLTTEEQFPLTRVSDTFSEVITFSDSVATPLEEDLGATADELQLFRSNDFASTTNEITDRTFHNDLTYADITALSILGSANVGLWLNAENVQSVDGIAVDGMIDGSPTGADVSQPTPAFRPTIILIGGKKYVDFDNIATQYLDATSLVTNIWPVGNQTATVWWIGRWDDFALQSMLFDLQDSGIGGNSGVAVRSFPANPGFFGRVYAGGSFGTVNVVGFSNTSVGVYEIRYDGSAITMSFDNVQIGTVAKTGTMPVCDSVFLGREGGSVSFMDGAFRELVVHRGATAPTATERTQMFNYLKSRQ